MWWNHKSFRFAVIALIGAVAWGCAGSDAHSVYLLTKHLWNGGDEAITLQSAAAVPFASIGVRVGRSPEFMLVLAADEGDQRLWTSGARIALTTRDSFIVRTAGLGRNLEGYEPRSIAKEGQSRRWAADFPDLGLYSVIIACHEKYSGEETIVILGKSIHTRRITETCSTETQLNWSFENTYWRDSNSNFVWRAVQYVHPNLTPIEIEVLRPPL